MGHLPGWPFAFVVLSPASLAYLPHLHANVFGSEAVTYLPSYSWSQSVPLPAPISLPLYCDSIVFIELCRLSQRLINSAASSFFSASVSVFIFAFCICFGSRFRFRLSSRRTQSPAISLPLSPSLSLWQTRVAGIFFTLMRIKLKITKRICAKWRRVRWVK